jgi:hypothetical protein
MAWGRFKVLSSGISVPDGPNESGHVSLAPAQNAYSSAFPSTELPFAGSAWQHGFSDGTLWNNLRSTPAKIFGTQVNAGPNFADSIAHLTGVWGANQSASATVFCGNLLSNTDSLAGVAEEVEILLRFSIDQGRATGYEITYSVDPNVTNGRYIQLNRWNGGLGSFTLLASGASTLVSNGAVVTASITGTIVSVAVNGTPVGGTFPYDTASDSPKYATGAPGIGHFYYNSTSVGTYAAPDFGFSAFSVTTN